MSAAASRHYRTSAMKTLAIAGRGTTALFYHLSDRVLKLDYGKVEYDRYNP